MEKKIIKRQKILIAILCLMIFALAVVLIMVSTKLSKEIEKNAKLNEELSNSKNIKFDLNKDINELPIYSKDLNLDYTRYSGNLDIEFYYPSDWIVAGTDDNPAFVSEDDTGESVNVFVMDYPSGMSLEGFIESSKYNLMQEVNVIGEINEEMINLNGNVAYRIDYMMNDEENGNLNITQIVLVYEEKVYIMTTTAKESQYKEVQYELENIIKSFDK